MGHGVYYIFKAPKAHIIAVHVASGSGASHGEPTRALPASVRRCPRKVSLRRESTYPLEHTKHNYTEITHVGWPVTQEQLLTVCVRARVCVCV